MEVTTSTCHRSRQELGGATLGALACGDWTTSLAALVPGPEPSLPTNGTLRGSQGHIWPPGISARSFAWPA